MLLTDSQLHEIRQTIRDHHDAFVANTISPDALAQETVTRLRDKGLLRSGISVIEEAYLYGHVMAILESPKAASMSYDEFKRYLTKNPIPLTDIELRAMQYAQHQAAQYAQGLGNKVNLATGQTLIEADSALRARTIGGIRDATAENIAKRQTVKQLKSDLGWMAKDWARDWDRIAITEKHNAMMRGVADNYSERFGPDVWVFKRPMPDACKHCKRLYLDGNQVPRIFKLSTLEANGTNVGRKAADWLPVIGATHPHCFVPGTLVQTLRGEVPVEAVVPGDYVLSGAGSWQQVTHTWAQAYTGTVVSLALGNGRVVVSTIEHPHMTPLGAVAAQDLQEGDDLLYFDSNVRRAALVEANAKQVPPPGKQEALFAEVLFGFTGGGVPVSAIYFNGQLFVREGDVNEEEAQLIAGFRVEARSNQGLVDPAFGFRFEFTGLPGNTGLDEVFGLRLTTDGSVKSRQVGASLFWRELGHSIAHSFGSTPRDVAGGFDASDDSATGASQSICYLFHRKQVVEVHLDDMGGGQFGPAGSAFIHGDTMPLVRPIVNVSQRYYSGLVYNLTVAGEHTYTANGVVTHNCQCQLGRVPEGWGFDEDGSVVPGGKYGTRYKDAGELARAIRHDMDLMKAYKLQGHRIFQGLPIAIENRAGTYRHWHDADGQCGRTLMKLDYGYIKRTNGTDEDELDVFIGPNDDAELAFVVHQQNPHTGVYDEEKIMLGFGTADAAEAAYREHYDLADNFYLTTSPMGIDQLKRWMAETKPDQGEMAKGPRLVIGLSDAELQKSLEKGNYSPGHPAESSRAAARNPGPGTAVNFYVTAPRKPVHLGDVGFSKERDELMRKKNGETAHESMKRDQKDWDFNQPVKRNVKPIEVPDTREQNRDGARDAAEDNREKLDQYAQEKFDAPENKVPKKKIKRTPVVKDEDEEDGEA